MRLPPGLQPVVARLRKHRAPALAAEVAFFGLLSIPPLLVGLVATAGLVARALGPQTISNVTDYLIQLSGTAFSADVTQRLVKPSIQEVLTQQRLDALSLGYLLAIWSGSRMVNALYQGVEILSEQHAERSTVQTRLRAIKTLVLGLFAVTLALPLLIAGPRILAALLSWYANILIWIAIAVVIVIAVAWLLRQAIPRAPAWKPAMIGGAGVMLGWLVVTVLLQLWFARSVSKPSLYGPLAAPIALLFWMQLVALVFFVAATVIALGNRAVTNGDSTF